MVENDFYIEERDMTLDEVKAALKKYERKYGMTSEEFYEKWKKGETEFVSESVDWSGLFEAYGVLNGQNHHSNERLKEEATTMVEPDFYVEEREMTFDEVKAALKKYERKYGMTSETFYDKWKRGEAYLVSESVIWVSLLELYQFMNGKDCENGKAV